MYRNNNHYWKKSFNTTNVEVVIDDPLQIQDTYITNSVYFSNIAVFDKTANDFVYQTPASNNSSVVYQTQGTVIATGVPGDGAVTVDSELGVIGAAIHTGPIGTSGGTGGTGDDGGFVGPPGPRECVELFNKFLDLLRKLHSQHLTYAMLLKFAGTRRILGDIPFSSYGIADYWLGDLPPDHPLYKFIACMLEKETGISRGFFENPLEYIRRVRQNPSFPGTNLPFQFPGLIPIIPGIPSDADGVERWFESYPELLENFERDLRKILERLKQERNDQDVLSTIPASCIDEYKKAIDVISTDFNEVWILFDLLLKLKKAFDELKNSPCWEILNLEEEFNRRQIGRFGTLSEFFKWLQMILLQMIDSSLDDIKPDIDPAKLSDIQSMILINTNYGNIPTRYETAFAAYQSWASEPSETRAYYPPIRGLFRIFDGPNYTDEDAYIGLISYLVMNFTEEWYRGDKYKGFDFSDAVMQLSIFAAQPPNSFIPPSWRQTP